MSTILALALGKAMRATTGSCVLFLRFVYLMFIDTGLIGATNTDIEIQ